MHATPRTTAKPLPRDTNGHGIGHAEATAADTIALLAGVDFRGVQRVLAAIEAMRLSGFKLDEITRIDHMPTEPAKPPRPENNYARSARWDATQQLACAVASLPAVGRLSQYLRLDRLDQRRQ